MTPTCLHRLSSSDGVGRARLLGAVAAAALLLGVCVWAVDAPPNEVEALGATLDVRPGDTVADIGAGTGWLSLEIARVVGPTGRVYATELSPARREAIRAAAAEAGIDLDVVEAGVSDTNLPPGCCDAIFMRRVYHHLSDAAAINRSLHASIRPGGRLAIIEMEPTGLFTPLRVWPHWTDDARVVAEVTAAGFRHLRTDDWPGLGHYVALFAR